MQSATAMPTMSFGKDLREGHRRLLAALDDHEHRLNAKLPTGYGKTYGCALVYSVLKQRGRVNRLLVIVPTDAQLEQFMLDGHKELADARVDGPLEVIDIRYFGVEAIKRHRRNSAQVFVITIQSLQESRGSNNCHDLLSSGKWMVCVDEYHHYGIEKSWGKAALALPCDFLLAMSATPTRRQNDSAFGLPDVSVTYREAVEEGVVKPLRGHSYRYQLDAIDDAGHIISFTSAELVEAAGGDDPERIERFRIRRQMRWSPKYISPLVSIPIERLQRASIASGYRLQALVHAMCVSHARHICEQIRAMFPELQVDWVGTGTDGRTVEENRAILRRFCPSKDEYGQRNPTLDVLVNVGLAGEGLDSIHVAEVMFLSNASHCNKNGQAIGRGSRFLPDVECNVNFDASSDYATKGYLGKAVMDALDDEPPTEDEEPEYDNEGEWDGEWEPLPEEPKIRLFDLRFLGIDSGDPGVQRMARVAQEVGVAGIDYEGLMRDPEHRDWPRITDLYRTMRTREAEAFNQKAITEQWRDAVSRALTVVAGLVIRIVADKQGRVDKSFAGDVKKRINSRKYRLLGPVEPSVEICRRHYQWLRQLEAEILRDGPPTWLL